MDAYHLRHDNGIIHEFAHEIDFMDGEIDGVPPLERSKYDSWTKVLYEDFRLIYQHLFDDFFHFFNLFSADLRICYFNDSFYRDGSYLVKYDKTIISKLDSCWIVFFPGSHRRYDDIAKVHLIG